MNPAAARTRAELGEVFRIVATVAGDHARLRRVLSLATDDVIGQASGTFGDRPVIEDVRTHGIHHSPPAAGAELQNSEKGVVQDLPPTLGDVLEQPGPVLHERALGQPAANGRRRRGGELPGLLGLAHLGYGFFGARHGWKTPLPLRLWLVWRSIHFVFEAEFKANPIRPNQQAGAPVVEILAIERPAQETPLFGRRNPKL